MFPCMYSNWKQQWSVFARFLPEQICLFILRKTKQNKLIDLYNESVCDNIYDECVEVNA